MAFIDKKNPVVLNIKITSKGRETLSKGHLHFRKFAIGDSEIDYKFLRDSKLPDSASSDADEYNIFKIKMLKPVDKNPNILSFITKNPIQADDLFTGEQFNELTSVPSISWSVENSVESIGFFSKNDNNFEFKTTSEYVKQPDIEVDLTDVTGGTTLNLYRGVDYGANLTEPEVGDFLMVRWIGDKINTNDTINYVIDSEQPAPIVFYKITEITSGSLSSNDLVVEVDRDLPYLNEGNGSFAGAMIFYSDVNLNVEQQFSTDYVNEALLSFLQNCQCDTIIFPFWKLSIIYTNNIIGVNENDKQYHQYKTNKYNGFVNYIQNQDPKIKKMGVIHYSNVSPANVYAEQFLKDTPTLHLPTIMWHKSSTTKLGLTLKAFGDPKTITGVETSLNTTYYDLSDLDGNVVGKVFNNLKLFVIEDQELLFAMSYKSNRSWTLPNFKVGVNDSVSFDCPTCNPDFDFNYTTTNQTSSTLGSITINNINKYDISNILVIIKRNNDTVFSEELMNRETITCDELTAGTYDVILYDLSAPDCKVEKTVVVESELLIPLVKTGDANSNDVDFKVLNNEVLDIGNANIERYGIIWTQDQSIVDNNLEFDSVNTTNRDNYNGSISINTLFSGETRILSYDTNTWYRAYAKNSYGYGYGEIKTLKTNPRVIDLELTEYSATTNTLSPNGEESCVQACLSFNPQLQSSESVDLSLEIRLDNSSSSTDFQVDTYSCVTICYDTNNCVSYENSGPSLVVNSESNTYSPSISGAKLWLYSCAVMDNNANIGEFVEAKSNVSISQINNEEGISINNNTDTISSESYDEKV